jgi:hypothetical protein
VIEQTMGRVLQGCLIVSAIVMFMSLLALLVNEYVGRVREWRRKRLAKKGHRSLKRMSLREWNLIEKNLRRKGG